MYFPSKRDLWLGFIILGATGGAALAMIGDIGFSISSFLMFLPFVFACWVWFGTGYYVKDDVLIVKFGPFFKKVELSSITSIVRTRTIVSHPACSFDRIKLKSLNRTLTVISPRDQKKFLECIKDKNTSITIHL